MIALKNSIQEGIDSGKAHDFDPKKHLEALKEKKHFNVEYNVLYQTMILNSPMGSKSMELYRSFGLQGMENFSRLAFILTPWISLIILKDS